MGGASVLRLAAADRRPDAPDLAGEHSPGLCGAEGRTIKLPLQGLPPRSGRLKQRIKEIATTRVRYGYRRITVLLRREGWGVNGKRIYRL